LAVTATHAYQDDPRNADILICVNGEHKPRAEALCRAEGIPAFERNFSLTDVYSADEAFVTGTFAGVAPVGTVDGRTIGSGRRGPMVDRLQGLYKGLLDRVCSE
jgi:branched-chain amino acid aminotransferase